MDSVKEKESYSRINKKNTIILQVVKRAGENLINTSEKIKAIIADMKVRFFPRSCCNDQR